MKRPSFQFYPADWRGNANLRRCSEAARGAWLDIICTLHDSDEYGLSRWPLADLARAAGVAMKLIQELVSKLVLKGADHGPVKFIHTPRHAGKDGEPVTLIDGEGPIWFSSRMVTDEWRRKVSGGKTRFVETKPVTTPRLGDDLGDGATTSSSPSEQDTTSLRSVVVPKRKSSRSIPEGFPFKADLDWAEKHWLKRGRADLCALMADEVAKFQDRCLREDSRYADWPAAWRTWARNAIKYNDGGHNGRRTNRPTAHENFALGALAAAEDFARGNGD